jgi:hypothetical protein
MDDIRQKVDQLIISKTIGYQLPKRLYLPVREWLELYAVVKPILMEQFGSLLIDENARKDGYENFIYRKVAICLEATDREIRELDKKLKQVERYLDKKAKIRKMGRSKASPEAIIAKLRRRINGKRIKGYPNIQVFLMRKEWDVLYHYLMKNGGVEVDSELWDKGTLNLLFEGVPVTTYL